MPQRYFIWGMGLLGTSLAFDLKKIGHRVSGCVNSERSLGIIKELGFDEVFLASDSRKNDFLSAAQGIIIGTPVDTIAAILEEIDSLKISSDYYITDMASTKADLMRWVEAALPHLPFIGSHPMAGSDHIGPQNGRFELFQKATIYITPSERIASKVGSEKYEGIQKAVILFWQMVGACPQIVAYSKHDQWAAYLSHGLHLVSCMVSHLVKDIPDVFHLSSPPAAGSFRDITRVSGSNPALWDGIISTNRAEVQKYLEALEKLVHDWRIQFENQQLDIQKVFSEAAEIRQRIMHKKDN